MAFSLATKRQQLRFLISCSVRIITNRSCNVCQKLYSTNPREHDLQTSQITESETHLFQKSNLVKSTSETKDIKNAEHRREKMAMLLSYCGKNYFGMMRLKHRGIRSIEGELLAAMLKAKIISIKLFWNPEELIAFQRASKTDKGVSAVRQVICLRLYPQNDLVERINQFLPPEIRVVEYKRVKNWFDSWRCCNGRTYRYMLPTYAFARLTEITSENYKISNDTLIELSSHLSKYEGRHNFYNYTSNRKPDDADCIRDIKYFKCGTPFVMEGIEFVVIEIKGVGFIQHQIRKMIGLVIAVMRGLAPPTIIEKAWNLNKLDLPKAPGLGLMLEYVHYDVYNARHTGDGIFDPLTWEEHDDTIDRFKKEHIIKTIVDTEKYERAMLNWLEALPFCTFEPRPPSHPCYFYLRSPFLCAYANIKASNETCDYNRNNALDPAGIN